MASVLEGAELEAHGSHTVGSHSAVDEGLRAHTLATPGSECL